MAGKMDEKMKFVLEQMENYSTGIRFSEIYKLLENNFPDMTMGAIHGIIKTLPAKYGDVVDKPSKGLFVLKKFDQAITSNNITSSIKSTIKEEDFYEPFADYLVNELEECTEAIPLGGNKLGDKWGTPDVVGVLKPSISDIIKDLEIITAEIKIDTSSLITAFGQACAYKLFSHRVYLVIPEQSNKADLDRLDSLCCLFGIGLIVFNSNDLNNPNFQIKNRAQKAIPDTFYVNSKIKIIANKLKL